MVRSFGSVTKVVLITEAVLT